MLVSLVLGLGLEHSCPWPRECLSSKRLSLASDFFLCPWPWPRALCPRLHLWQIQQKKKDPSFKAIAAVVAQRLEILWKKASIPQLS